MTINTYQRVLDELSAVGFSGRFSPFLQCEPLLDKRLPELISMTRKSLPRAKLLIQSNGDMLTVTKGILLFKAGLHKLIINCYDNENGRLDRLRSVADEITKQMPDVSHVRGGFNRMIRQGPSNYIPMEITIEDKTKWTMDGQENWAGNVPGIHLTRQPVRARCFRPFNQLYIHYNGNVVLCCCDWKGEVVFGNLLEESLGKIFSGPLATMYRQNLNNKNRNMKLCDVCDFPGSIPLPVRIADRVTNFVNRFRDR
ncbi:MAG: SPASM domain-containing protein [Pseudomonadota bacterium]